MPIVVRRTDAAAPLVVLVVALALVLGMLVAPPASAGGRACARKEVVGESRRGVAIVACQIRGSDPDERPLLVVGSMHGDERAGMRIVSRLRKRDLSGRGANIWVIRTINPDGTAARTRVNARGVDLNGNFPTAGWHQRSRGTILWGGPRAASEPETRALMRAVRLLRPKRVVVFHQRANVIDCPPYRSKALSRRLHRWTGYRIRCMPVLTGNFTAWANARYRRTTAVTFELEARPRSARLTRVTKALVREARR